MLHLMFARRMLLFIYSREQIWAGAAVPINMYLYASGKATAASPGHLSAASLKSLLCYFGMALDTAGPISPAGDCEDAQSQAEREQRTQHIAVISQPLSSSSSWPLSRAENWLHWNSSWERICVVWGCALGGQGWSWWCLCDARGISWSARDGKRLMSVLLSSLDLGLEELLLDFKSYEELEVILKR